MRLPNSLIVIVCLISLACLSRAEATASFQGLGDLPGGDSYSAAHGVSADGSVVVGLGNSALGTEAFRWTAASGMVGLGDLPGSGFDSNAYSVSADGSIVVGQDGIGFALLEEAFRWVDLNGNGLVDPDEKLDYHPEFGLGKLDPVFSSMAYGVSADGSVVVGYGRCGFSFVQAFRWTAGEGMVGLGYLPGGELGSETYAASADGSVVAGRARSASGMEAFRWVDLNGNGLVDPDEKLDNHPEFGLGDLPGGSFDSCALGVSADGSVVVGYGNSASGCEAFRWTAGDGMVGLGDLPGYSFGSLARGVSADGSVVVGYGNSASGQEAVIWDAGNSMRNLRDVLVNDYGLDLTGWTLSEARGISASGLTIVGYGTNPGGLTEAWIATILPANVAPVAHANGPYIEPATSWDGALVWLDGSASYDPDGDPLEYSWKVGGVEIGAEPVITQPFAIGLTEDVSLTVTDPSGASDTETTTVTVTFIEVQIDIKPGSDPNSINLGSHGVVPVAFLTDETLDAASIDPASVTLAGQDFSGLVRMRGKKDQAPMADLKDVDGDGDLDLVVQLETENLALEPTAAICILGALTFDGLVVEGYDLVNIVPW